MTSKEIVLNEIKRLEHNLRIYEKKNNAFEVDVIKTDIEVNELILKDLEVLEILKHFAILYVNDVNKEVKSIQINISTCDNNFNKVEEWLESADNF